MTIQIGQTLPDIELSVLDGMHEGAEKQQTGALFAGRKVVMFAVPGAFTPTCSERHLPGYVAQFDAFKRRAIAVYCLSVNDAFVMHAWAKSQQVPEGLKLIADGSAAFTEALGLSMDGSAYGMGKRARRFALYAENRVVKQLNVEAPGELRVSSAEAMLKAVDS